MAPCKLFEKNVLVTQTCIANFQNIRGVTLVSTLGGGGGMRYQRKKSEFARQEGRGQRSNITNIQANYAYYYYINVKVIVVN